MTTGEKDTVRSKLKRLKLIQKAQLIAAVVVTLVILVTFPVKAWFSYQRSIAELQMIKSPDLLYLTAANAEAVRYFNMSGIDVQASKVVDGQTVDVTHKMFPFCVAGDYVSTFTLQFTHTSNNPFDYKIYEGVVYMREEDIPSGKEYVEYVVTGDFNKIFVEDLSRYSITPGAVIYIVKGSCLEKDDPENTEGYEGEYLNMSDDNRTANTDFLEECYGDYRTYTDYELPLYWQCSGIPSTESSLSHPATFFKTFIIDVSWEGKGMINSKETDIVYVMAFTGNN